MIDAKKLLVFSMISTGVLGLWEATWPSYNILLLIYILWAFTTVLTYWSSSIKCINLIADTNEQGTMFGSLEAGRGIINFLLTTVFVAIYTATSSITNVVIIISIVMILCGILQLILMPNTATEESTNKNIKDSMKAMLGAFKLPITYLLAAMIFGASIAKATSSYYTPFLEKVIGVDIKITTIFANYNNTITNIIGAAIATILATKIGRSSKPMLFAGVIIIVDCLLLILFPHTSAFLLPFFFMFIIISLCTYVFRALYYAVIEEVGTPKNMVGSVIGIASLIGFIPDTFYLSMCGKWIEEYGNKAYNMIFTFCLAAAVIGFIGAYISDKKIKKHRLLN